MKTPEGSAKAQKGTRLVPLLCLLSGGLLFGISSNLAKVAGDLGLPPLVFLCWSVIGAALILFVISAMRRNLPPINGRALEYYSVSALVGVAGSNLIFFSAIPHIGASFVALIITLPPLLTYVGALAFKLERFQLMRAAGVAAALAGTGVLAGRELSLPHTDKFWILLTLVGPVLLAIGNLYRTMRWPPNASADALAPGMLIATAVILLAAGLLPGFSLAVPMDQHLPIILILTQASIFAGQFLLLFLLQKTGGPVFLSLLGAVAAVVAVPVAIFLQGEAPPKGLFWGAVLIGAGITLLCLGKSRAE